MYITHDGNRWRAPETVDNERVSGSYNALRFDSNDKPHIVYTKNDPNVVFYEVLYVNKVGRAWSEKITLGQDQGQATGMYTQMTMDSQNNIFVIFVDQFLSALFPDVNYLKLASLDFVDRGIDHISSRTDRLAFSIIPMINYMGLAIAIDDNHHLTAAWAQESGRLFDLITARLSSWDPAVTLLKPDADSNSGRDNFELQWLDFDPDSNARIRFTRRDANWDTVTFNETAREDDANKIVLSLADVSAGEYAIGAEISDDDFNMTSGSWGRSRPSHSREHSRNNRPSALRITVVAIMLAQAQRGPAAIQ